MCISTFYILSPLSIIYNIYIHLIYTGFFLSEVLGWLSIAIPRSLSLLSNQWQESHLACNNHQQPAVDENIGDYCMLNAIPATGWIIKINSRYNNYIQDVEIHHI